MYFYEVAPASRQYHGTNLLTYSSPSELVPGQIIVVKIRSLTVTAFIVSTVPKPTFKTSPIASVIPLILPPEHLALFTWLQGYYPAPVGLIAQLFLPLPSAKDYLPKPPTKASLAAAPGHAPISPLSKSSLKINEKNHRAENTLTAPRLTAEQNAAIKVLNDPKNPTVVLHGDTGTGKTRVYIELAQNAIKEGRSVLILVPEIALSPQIVNSFETYVYAPVRVTHSGLTPVERRNAWQEIANASHNKQPQIVIGPRSALFTPLANVGLVVVDEFHESAYKQDQAPYYQTLRAASQFARLHNAKLVMGSATPPVSEYFIAEQKNVPIVRMTEKAAKKEAGAEDQTIDTQVVNLKSEDERTNYPLVSKSLLNEVGKALARGEQSLLFLNKRGSARLILCQNCGWHAVCDNCDLPMTFHADTYTLQCHTCGAKQPAPSVCPSCSSHDIMFKSPGTKAIVEAIAKHFPDAKVARFDKDNKKSERLETRHGEIVSGEIDILIGTQLLAKGHDLPRLSLVGILLAENELQFPDYTSSERSYQLMHQLIGRVGRGHRNGTVVVQTYDPENMAVQTAIRAQSWENFYSAQIKERQAFDFPPFMYLMKIEISRAKLATVMTTCQQVLDYLHESGEPIKVTNPVPSFIEKKSNTYNWQIIVRAKQRPALVRLASAIPVKCTVNLDPSNLL